MEDAVEDCKEYLFNQEADFVSMPLVLLCLVHVMNLRDVVAAS